MKSHHIRLYVFLICLFGAHLAIGQDLSPLATVPTLKHEVFPDGLSCYIMENKSEKGFADVLLLRRNYADSSVVYSNENIVVATEEALDSTLIRIMHVVREEGAPADQAVIISGDINASSLMMKLKYMSLMIDKSIPSVQPEYSWTGNTRIVQKCIDDTTSGLSSIIFEWEAPRAPEKYLRTTQSAVYKKAAWELGDVACRWIRRTLRGMSIPVAKVSYTCGADAVRLSDEQYALAVVVADDDAERAAAAVESVLALIDAGMTSESDVALAHNAYVRHLEAKYNAEGQENSYYVKLCADAFLYNTPLTSDKEILALFRSKDVNIQARKNIFSGITSALLDISSSVDTVSSPVHVMLSDTLAFPAAGEKLKIRSQKPAPLSGGVMWAFSNGFKVIYKQMPTNRDIYYSLSLNGGYGNVPELKKGEGRFFSDYADLCWISGMKGGNFKHILDLSGMTMDTRVNMYNTVISGKVQDRNAHLLMKGLLAFANHRSLDQEEAAYYVKSRSLGHLDGKTCVPDDGTMRKADELFAGLTSKMNDGVLVIVCDMEPAEFKKALQLYVGQFKVKSVATRRPSQNDPQTAGVSTYYKDAEEESIKVAITARMPMTAENYMAVELSMMLLEKKLREEFSSRSQTVELSFDRDIYPEERFRVVVKVSGASSEEDLQRVRACMSAYSSEAVDDVLLKACRENVKHKYALHMQQPQYWLTVIPLRHLEGKDFTTGYAAKIDSVSPAKIKDIFRAIENGAGVEIITRNK